MEGSGSLADTIAQLSDALVEASWDSARLSASSVVHWLRRQGLSDDSDEAEGAVWELHLFYFALCHQLVATVSSLPHEMRAPVFAQSAERLEYAAWRTYPRLLHRKIAGVSTQLEARLAEYDAELVRRALVDVDVSAQTTLCQVFFGNAAVVPTSNEAWYFRIALCQTFYRASFGLLDRIYVEVGPNSRWRQLHDMEAPQAPTCSTCLMTSSAPGLDLVKLGARTRARNLTALVVSVLTLLLLAIMIGTQVLATMDVLSQQRAKELFWPAHFTIVGALVAVFVVRHGRSAQAGLTALNSGRYVLYLRSSDVDESPPHVGFEINLTAALSMVGPVVSIGPSSVLRPTGGIKLPLREGDWEVDVARLARNAALTVMVMAPRRGYDKEWGCVDDSWKEIESIAHLTSPGRLLVMLPRYSGDQPLVLLHPKGDRTYGVSTMLYEIRRLLARRSSLRFPPNMGRSEWIWRISADRFERLPAPRRPFAVQLGRRHIVGALMPVFRSFNVPLHGQRRWWWLVAGGFLLACVLPEAVAESLRSSFDSPVTKVASFAMLGFLTWRVALAIRKTSRWFSYCNSIRPRPIHAFGLAGCPPGGQHEDLPY